MCVYVCVYLANLYSLFSLNHSQYDRAVSGGPIRKCPGIKGFRSAGSAAFLEQADYLHQLQQRHKWKATTSEHFDVGGAKGRKFAATAMEIRPNHAFTPREGWHRQGLIGLLAELCPTADKALNRGQKYGISFPEHV